MIKDYKQGKTLQDTNIAVINSLIDSRDYRHKRKSEPSDKGKKSAKRRKTSPSYIHIVNNSRRIHKRKRRRKEEEKKPPIFIELGKNRREKGTNEKDKHQAG
jgi:hypothetical protein